jgi:hypothetical protein
MMMRAIALAVVVVGLAGAACGGPPPCDTPRVYPATGSGVVISGQLATGAQDQRVVISPDRRFLEYTFTRNGTTTTARYALSEVSPEPALYFVTIRRPSNQADCAALAGRGPVIDAIEVNRGGSVISDARAGFSAASCGQPLNDKGPVELDGPPDGIGLALGGNEVEWTVAPRITLVSGDEITVTVLDDSGEPFEVYASHSLTSYGVKLGTLTGTGSVTMP